LSVELSKTAETGFLRDFHFSTLADVVLSEVFGELPQPSWVKFEIDSTLDAQFARFLFRITVRIEPHSRKAVVDGAILQSRFDRSKKFHFDFGLPRNVVEQFRSDVPKLFVKWMNDTLLKNAYRIYEFDPRIGFIWDGGSGLPRCPLFDPPEDFSRTGLPVEGKKLTILEPSCAFCGEDHREGDRPVWGGANMMWLHRGCWRTPS
jgi:hypothetical protein